MKVNTFFLRGNGDQVQAQVEMKTWNDDVIFFTSIFIQRNRTSEWVHVRTNPKKMSKNPSDSDAESQRLENVLRWISKDELNEARLAAWEALKPIPIE